MTHREVRGWLKKLGASFKEGSKHTRVYLNGRQSTLARHGNQEMGPGTLKAICKQLGIETPN